MRIAIFGCGYVGLVTAACFARMGHSVACVDTERMKIADLQSGRAPFFEPGLEKLIVDQISAGRLSFTDKSTNVLKYARIAFIAVGTPTGPTGEADLTYVRQCVMQIAEHADGPLLVVNKSTVPVETSDVVQRLIAQCAHDPSLFSVASNPEFLREGSAIGDFMHPDRIVIGCDKREDVRLLEALYEPLGAPLIVVSLHTAEMIKYAANAFLAMKISFINEIANVCGAVDADIDGVVDGIGSDSRIGRSYLQPGLGFGGSCLPKDVAALASVARAHGIEPTMLDASLSVNRRQVACAVRLIEEAAGDLFERPIALAGIAFKGETDDLRESPALVLAKALLTRGARVTVYDRHALPAARAALGDRVSFAQNLEDAARGADVLAIGSDDRAFAEIDWRVIAPLLRQRNVVDLRNRVDRRAVTAAGLRYRGVGRATQVMTA